MSNDIILVGLIFLGVLFVLAIVGYTLSEAGGANKKARQRLDRIRARFGYGEATAQARSILLSESSGNSVEAALGRLVPRPERFRKRLAQTGKDIPLGRYAGICAATVLIATLFFSLFLDLALFLSLLIGVIIGVGLPHLVVGKMIAKRQKRFLSLFPEAIELIVRGLKSGLPINETLTIVGSEVADPVGHEFRKISDQIRFGKTIDDAMWDATKQLDFPDFKFFVISLAIQRETGGNLAETLENLANILRQRHQMKLKVKALSSEGRASAMIIGCLPFIMFGIIYALNSEYAGTFFEDKRAMIALIGAMIWMGIGGFIISKMINFEI